MLATLSASGDVVTVLVVLAILALIVFIVRR
jgi:hypothetical protein